MGGRGANGGASNIAGLRVTFQGQTSTYYFSRIDGRNYYQRGLSDTPEETPGNVTIKQFRDRVISNGATVQNITISEKKKVEIARAADRKATDEFLDRAYASDKTFVKGSRAERIRNRANRRRR